MQEKARSLCESLEGRVDPFDLDVFNPHIQSHVKRAVQRLQVMLQMLNISDDYFLTLFFSRSLFLVHFWLQIVTPSYGRLV